MIAKMENVKIFSFRKGISKNDDPYASCKIVDDGNGQIYDMFTMRFDDIEKLEVAKEMGVVDIEVNIEQGFKNLQFGKIESIG